jgi:hypothetical protein
LPSDVTPTSAAAIVRSTSADQVVREKKMALGEKTQP